MNRDTLGSCSKEELIALIEALTKQIGVLTKRVEALEAELGKPPKTHWTVWSCPTILGSGSRERHRKGGWIVERRNPGAHAALRH